MSRVRHKRTHPGWLHVSFCFCGFKNKMKTQIFLLLVHTHFFCFTYLSLSPNETTNQTKKTGIIVQHPGALFSLFSCFDYYFSQMFEGYSMTRTDAPIARDGRFDRKVARTVPVAPCARWMRPQMTL